MLKRENPIHQNHIPMLSFDAVAEIRVYLLCQCMAAHLTLSKPRSHLEFQVQREQFTLNAERILIRCLYSSYLV